jgi:murein DD-endopeptidase MepM/ murein hydrolase activator NlpD
MANREDGRASRPLSESALPAQPSSTTFGWRRSEEAVAPKTAVPQTSNSKNKEIETARPGEAVRPLSSAPQPRFTPTTIAASLAPAASPMVQEPDEYSFWWPEGVQPRPIVTGPVQTPQSGNLTRSAMVAATVAAVAGSAFFGPALGAAVAQTPSKTPNANPNSPTTAKSAAPAAAATGIGGGGQGIDYEVKDGDTLYSIAQQYGVSTLSVIAANDFANPDLILPGQHVTIPTDGNGSTASDVTITVAEGDTVGNLADHYGVSAASIVIANSLSNPNLIVVGQSLVIPGGGGSSSNASASADSGDTATYASADTSTADSGSSDASTANDATVTVKDGDTINKLADQYGVSAASIISANSLSNPNVIVVGQSLTIPGGAANQPATNADSGTADNSGGQGGQGGQSTTAQLDSAPATQPSAPATPAPTATPEPTPAPTPPPAPAASQGFVWPVQGTITQNFGPTGLSLEPAYEGYAHFHQGLDIANSMYTPIHAAGAGTVIFAGWSNSGYGFCVKIDHGNGLVTLYGHMAQQPSVSVGETVSAGELIGKMGSTGASTGPHTHFAVLKNGVWVNPLNYLP